MTRSMGALAFAIGALLLAAGACAPRVMPPGEAIAPPAIDGDHLRMPDGSHLPLRVWRPEGKPRVVVLALHGFNDYSNAFDAPARTLARDGVLTYAYDQRGFGGAPHRGIWPGVRGLTGDLRVASRLIKARHPDTHLVLLGESMGSSVIMAAMAEDDPPTADRVVLSAPAVWARAIMRNWQRGLLYFFAHTIRAVQFTGQGMGKVPSDNIPMLRSLGRDPKVIKWTRVDAAYGLVNLMDAALDAAPALRGDVLILLGQNEDIIPGFAMTAFRQRLPMQECGIRIAQYDSGFHMLLRDLNADRVLGDITAWLDNPETALPSGSERPLTVADASKGPENGLKEGDGATAPLAVHCAGSKQARRP